MNRPVQSAGLGPHPARRGALNVLKMTGGHMATLAILSVAGVVIPRVLGLEHYGQYAAVLAVITLLQNLSSGGLRRVAVRYLTPLWQTQQRAEAVVLGSSIWTVQMLLSFVAGCLAVGWLSQSAALKLSAWVLPVLGLWCFSRAALDTTCSQFLAIGHIGKLAGIEFGRVFLHLLIVVGGFITFGLNGAFCALLGVNLVLLVGTGTLLRRSFPIQPSHFRWAVLQPYLGYGTFSFLGLLGQLLPAHFSVYAVAIWTSPSEAGVLAVAMQLTTVVRSLFQSAYRSLLPLLAELEADGQEARLRYWGGLILRYTTALSCSLAVGWALLGAYLVEWLLTTQFATVYPCATALLLSGIFFSAASCCNGLLYIRGWAGLAALNTVVHATVIMSGLALLLGGLDLRTAYALSWLYVFGSVLFFGTTYFSLGLWAGLWLPLRRTLLLLLPLVGVWPASGWEAGLLPRLLSCLGFCLGYAGFAVGLGLLPGEEIRTLWQTFRHTKGQSAQSQSAKTEYRTLDQAG